MMARKSRLHALLHRRRRRKSDDEEYSGSSALSVFPDALVRC